MFSDIESEDSVCSYTYSPENLKNVSSTEESDHEGAVDCGGNQSGTIGFGRDSAFAAIRYRKRRITEYPSSDSSDSEGDEKEEEGGKRTSTSKRQKIENERRRGDQAGADLYRELESYFDSLDNYSNVDTGHPVTWENNIGGINTFSFGNEAIRSEEDNLFIDGLPSICFKNATEQKKELGKCSLKNLVQDLLSLESSTTFTDATVTLESSDWILNNYAENFLGPSCSSRTTGTTSTSSTIVATPTIPVDVPSSIICPSNKSIEDMLEESFSGGSSRSTTGAISQSICRKASGITSTSISPGERGYQVVKLDVFDFSKIVKKPKTEWWKEANYRSTFLIHSPLDPKYQLIMKLLLAASTEINKIPGVKRIKLNFR